MPTPTNKALYKKVLAEAKKKFDVYPSAYANSWVSHHFKSLGGKYSGSKSKNLDIAISAFERARSVKKSSKRKMSKKRTSKKRSRKHRKRV